MSTYRYSGEIRIRITYIDFDPYDCYSDGTFRHPNGSYRCFVRSPDGDGDYTCIVGAPTHLSEGVDSPEAFDKAGMAALHFAEDNAASNQRKGKDFISWSNYIAYTMDGIHIGRNKKNTWSEE